MSVVHIRYILYYLIGDQVQDIESTQQSTNGRLFTLTYGLLYISIKVLIKPFSGTTKRRWNFSLVTSCCYYALVARYQSLVASYQLLVTSYKLLLTCYQSLVTSHQLLVTNYQSLVTSHQLLVTSCQLLITSPQLLVTRCYSPFLNNISRQNDICQGYSREMFGGIYLF